MRTSCRAANLRPLLRDPAVSNALQEFTDVYHALSGEDERGMRLDSVLRSTGTSSVPDLADAPGGKYTALDEDTYSALLRLLNGDSPASSYVDPKIARKGEQQRNLSRQALARNDIVISGIHYRTVQAASRDSNIQFTIPGRDRASAGSIMSIFIHRRKSLQGDVVQETFLSVCELAELRPEDMQYDHFRRFPYVGGQLYRNEYTAGVYVLRPCDVHCHVARTPLVVPRITDVCVHVLPLDRVRSILCMITAAC